MFNALSVVKFVASGVVGIGTGKIVGQVIKTHTNPETLIDKVTMTAAAWTISGAATAATKKYTNEMIDETYEAVNKVVGQFKLRAKLQRINKGESTFEEEGLDKAQFHMNGDNQWAPQVVAKDETTVGS